MKVRKHLIVRSPYRISLGGGGTDLPFYASQKEGFLITGAIDVYMTILVARRNLDKKIFLQYSNTEMVDALEDISHRMLREILRYFKITDSFQVATFSTMPSYTGLGASSTLVVGIVKAIRELCGIATHPIKLAEEAFHIEREILGFAGGFQDQYIAALGGIQILEINKDLKVRAKALQIEERILKKLQKSFFIVHSGIERKSGKIIKEQEKKQKDVNVFDAYDQIKSIGKFSEDYLRNGDILKLGQAMDDHWRIKKSITKNISNSVIDQMYLELKSFGSPGGKIIGAGGGGFFLMVVDKNKKEFNKKVTDGGYRFVDFKFDFKGAHIVD